MRRWFFRDPDGTITEIVNQIQFGDDGTAGLTTSAEEGAVGSSVIYIEDPQGTFTIGGHRKIFCVETECEDDDYGGVIWVGYSADRQYGRADDRGLITGAARLIEVNVVDLNTVLDRRIMVENAKRPDETDYTRVQWAENSVQGSLIDDDSFVFNDNLVDMDGTDYRGQKFRDVIDDAAQDSGKNYYLTHFNTSGDTDPLTAGDLFTTYTLWYGKASRADYVSDIRISNDLDDIDSDVTFAPSTDATLKRDPSRVYSGIYGQYDKGNVFVERAQTSTDFALGGRDTSVPMPNVKTKNRATRRARRMLNDIATEEDSITTKIIVPATHVNKAMPGMWIDVKATHWANEGYGDFVPMRIVEKTIRDLSTTTDARYEVGLTLLGPAPDVAEGAENASAILLGPENSDANRSPIIYWEATGDSPPSGYPGSPTVGDLDFQTGGSMSHPYKGIEVTGTGTVDVTLNCSCIEVVLAGGSLVTLTIYKNGVAIASEVTSGTGAFISASLEVIAADVEVEPGDIITGQMTMTNVAAGWPAGKIPAGTGNIAHKLLVTGSLS